jgi:hypothetical protein
LSQRAAAWPCKARSLAEKQNAPKCVLEGASTKTDTKTSKSIHVSTPIRQDFFSRGNARPASSRGENDETFFRAHPNASQRLRLPFDAELPPEVWQPAAAAGLAAFVVVEMKRDVTPWIRSRKFVLTAGGNA